MFCLWLSLLLQVASSFEIFSEQQVVSLLDPSQVANYNNTNLSSTSIDDYWTQLDSTYSPLEGWTLDKYVRIGCFDVIWESAGEGSFTETVSPNVTDLQCVTSCNRSQAYLRVPSCRCAINETAIPWTEDPACSPTSWQVYREYDYRSSMGPSTYDVSRLLLYQIVSVRLPNIDPSMRHFLRAMNALQAQPMFSYDTRLDRLVFNAVWDFGNSRLVALSYADWGAALDFTIVSFNTSSGSLVVTQNHYPIQDQIVAVGYPTATINSFASIDGLGTVDILYGTYYTVVPAQLATSPQVVHVVVAIDINKHMVLSSVSLPVTLMNMQINNLQHILYGAGADVMGAYTYYEICQATNRTVLVGGSTQLIITVGCRLNPLGSMPSEVHHMYLQSATMDHQYNYAWMVFKEKPTSFPRIMEYNQDRASYILWPEDALPEEAVFSSMINLAPRVLFSLAAPSIKSAVFDPDGTRIYVDMDSNTLRGAIPSFDVTGVPKSWNQSDMMTTGPCSKLLDSSSMNLIPDATCQWTTDASFIIQLSQFATIVPGNIIRIKPSTLYAGKILPSGAKEFSQPSTSFAPVQPPSPIPQPQADLSMSRLADTCTPVALDASASTGYGFRGKFTWTLQQTVPSKPDPHIRAIQAVVSNQVQSSLPFWPKIIHIPANLLQAGTSYFFSVTVTSFWNANMTSTVTQSVFISPTPIPVLSISGASVITTTVPESLTLSAIMTQSGCSVLEVPTITFNWYGCLVSDASPWLSGVLACPNTTLFSSTINASGVSGFASKTLFVASGSLTALNRYLFTVVGQAFNADKSVLMTNVASVEVDVTLSNLTIEPYGGTAFSVPPTSPVVVDISSVLNDPADPMNQFPGNSTFTWACYLPNGLACTTVLYTSNQATGVGTGRRLLDLSTIPAVLDDYACVGSVDPLTGAAQTFSFRGKDYSQAVGISMQPYSSDRIACTTSSYPGVLILQPSLVQPGDSFTIVALYTKIVKGIMRSSSATAVITVQGTQTGGGQQPLVTLSMESSKPVVSGALVRLSCQVTNANPASAYTFNWTVFRYEINPLYDSDAASMVANYSVPQMTYVALNLDLTNSENVLTKPGTGALALKPNVLSPLETYRVRCEATDVGLALDNSADRMGFAEESFNTSSLPPSGGRITASNSSAVGLATMVRLSLPGWSSKDTPLSYRYGYKKSWNDPQEEVTFLETLYTSRSYLDTVLPPGLPELDYQLQIYGYIMSAVGAVASIQMKLTVTQPDDASGLGLASLALDQAANSDPESALALASVVADWQGSSGPNVTLLNSLFNVVSSSIVNSIPGHIPNTPEMQAGAAGFLSKMADQGLRTDQVANAMESVVNKSLYSGFISVDAAYEAAASGTSDAARVLLKSINSIIPGEAPAIAAQRRLARTQRWVHPEVRRRLQIAQGLETRTRQEQYTQLLQAISMQRRIAKVLMAQMYVNEDYANYSTSGYDLLVGKEKNVQTGGAMAFQFTLPSLSSTIVPNIAFRMVHWRKFPYNFLTLPSNTSIDGSGVNSSFVPMGVTATTQGWYAMSLEICTEDGDCDAGGKLVANSLVNASFGVLPRISVQNSIFQNAVENPATCYYVELGAGNISKAYFDPQVTLMDQESCVTSKLPDMVVFLDNLAAALGVVQQTAGETAGSALPSSRTPAMVSSTVLFLVCGMVFAAMGFYFDVHQKESNLKPIDTEKLRVVDSEVEKEKLWGTIFLSFRRNHLIMGIWYLHKKMSREKRVLTILLAWLVTQSITTMLQQVGNFNASNGAFVATGLVAGVLVFPLVQFVEFLYEWRPESRTLPLPPPPSAPAQPIPLREQAQPMRFQVANKPQLNAIRPPPEDAPPRAGMGLRALALATLPMLPAGPSPKTAVELSPVAEETSHRDIPAPPERPRKGMRPKPPEGPVPDKVLTALKPQLALPAFASSSSEPSLGAKRLAVPALLALPELPHLATVKAEGSNVPQPPPKRPGTGPRPPQAPPPSKNMFFAMPNAVPSGQSTPLGPVSRLALPDLPHLATVKAEGSNVPGPPPKRPGTGPRPPQAPPPSKNTFFAMPNAVPSGQSTPLGPVSRLALPELPHLAAVKAEGSSVPKPPPKRPDTGPRPPQAPPPSTNMFSAMPDAVPSGESTPPPRPLRPPPRPPRPRDQSLLTPTPPRGPPPACAVVLAKKMAGPEDEALIAPLRRLPGVPVPPPEPTHGTFFYRGELEDIERRKALAIQAASRAGPRHVDPFLEAKPVPDFIVKAANGLILLFVVISLLLSCMLSIFYGAYLSPSEVGTTHAASIIGCIINFGIFESLKCVLTALIELVKFETAKRDREDEARFLRMALKQTRLQGLPHRSR